MHSTLNLHASISHSSVIYICMCICTCMYVCMYCMCMLDSVSNTFLYPTSGHSSSGFTCCVKVLKLHTYTNHCHATWSSKLDTFLPKVCDFHNLAKSVKFLLHKMFYPE